MIKKVFLTFLFFITCYCCVNGQAPVISGFLPKSGIQGANVIIAGSGFSTTPANNKVTFNGIPATVTSAFANNISVTVPAQTSLNYITVKVNGLSTTSLEPFDVTNTACANYTFGSPSVYSTGAIPDPYGLTVGDFNGDGYLDMASANSNTGSVSVLTGTGTGSLGNKLIYSVGTTPIHISSGDFNGDGFTDLVTANRDGNNISVLPGSASGVFGSQIQFNTGGSPMAVSVGDFNADGYQDVATANSSDSSVSVLLNTGIGLSPAVVYSVGTTPNFIAIGDFNNDKKLDLVTANSNSSNISVLTGTGTGIFSTAIPITLDVDFPTALVVGDFNDDGRQDLAIANSTSNSISVMLGIGIVSFGTQVVYNVGTAPKSIVIADFNGDGKQDLAIANYNSGSLSVLQGSGTGTFGSYTTLPGLGFPSCLAIGDFNGDSKHDLAVANSTTNLVSVFLGQCSLSTVIVQQPISATVCSGMVNTFTVSATGTGAITYVWSNGATGNTMNTSIAGNYMVTASGLGGVAVSNVVGLTVNTVPAINFNYGVGNYCKSGGTVTVSGTYPGGGTFSATPAGLSLNTTNGSIIPFFSTAQAYVVNYGVSIAGCGLIISATGITITGVPASGNISGPNMTCYNTSVTLSLNSATAGTTIQWKESLDGGSSYSSIGSGLTTVTGSVLSVNGTYMSLVSNGVCPVVSALGFGVSVINKNEGGTISGVTNLCSGTSASLSSSGTVGGVYQWQQFSGSFGDIGGANGPSYSTPFLGNGIYQYRLKVTNVYACTPGYSNVMTITAASCTLAANYTVTGAAVQQCISGNSFQFNDISTGSVTGWLWNFGSGASITSANTKGPYAITYSGTGSKTIFLSVVGAGGITSTFSGIVQVDDVGSVSTILSSLPTYCSNPQANLTITSAVGAIQWQVSSDLSSWGDIGGANGMQVVVGPVPNAYFRTRVINGACPAVYNTPVLVSVGGASIGGTAVADTNTVCQNMSASFGLTGFKGSIQWQISADGSTGWANVVGGSGASAANYTTAGLPNLQNYYYRAMVTNGTGCTPDYSNVLTIATASCGIAANYSVTGALTQCISGNSFQFNDRSSGTVTGWAWNFGSGSSPASANTKGPHTVNYSTSGSKTIFLSVVGTGGITATFSGIVQVDALGAFGSFLSTPTDPVCNTSTVGIGVSTITATNMLWYNSTDNISYKSTGITMPIFNTVLGVSTYFKPSITNGVCPAITSTGFLFIEIEDCGSIPVTAVTIGGPGGLTSITVPGGSLQIIADIYPASANSNTVPNWSITPTSVATIDGVTGVVTAISDGIATVTGTFGTVTGITIITITGQTIRQPQSIAFNPLPVKTFGDASFMLTATATSGLAVTYSSSDLSVAMISGNVLSIIGAGATTITASQIGSSAFFPATPIPQVLIVNKAIPTLILGDLAPRTLLSIPFFSLPLTVTSGLSLVANSSDQSVVVFIGLTASVTGSGTAQITVSFAGNNNYTAASNSKLLLVTAKQDQIITITNLPDLDFGISQITLIDTITSALPVSVSSSNLFVLNAAGKTVSITGAGTAILTYSQNGNALFNPAPLVYDTIIVNKAPQLITFPPIPEKIIEDRTFSLIAKSSSGLPVSYATSDSSIIALNASSAFILKVGVITLTATIAESANYLAAANAYAIVTVSSVPKIYFGIEGKNVVPTQTVLPFNAVSSHTVAGYSYAWSYLGAGATFMNDSTPATANIIFAIGATNGFLVLTVYDQYGNEVRNEGKYITIASSANTDYTQLSDLVCDDHIILCSKLYIENVRMNSLISTLTGCVPGGKSDFTSSPFTTTLFLGNTYNLDIECKSDSSVKTRYIGVWIDYANDGDFDDPDDFISAFYGTGDKLSIKNIPIRNVSAYAGIRKMRIRLRASKEFTALEYCETGETELGETEDYLLTLKEKDKLQAIQFISPNGDGENDLFIISGINSKESNKLTVLDKMGQVKFEKENYDNSWPSIAKDAQPIPEGTYFFHFNNGSDELKGYLVVKY